MRYFRAFVLSTLFAAAVYTSSAQKKLTIIGSSTSACYNIADPPNECYVGRLNLYYNKQLPSDTTIDNSLAVGGYNVLRGMPSSFVSPYPDPLFQPDAGHNITYALNVVPKPDVILVNYPTNGFDVLSVTEIMYYFRTIRDSANAKGVPCFVTTTQPRTGFSPANRDKLRELKDSILLEMGSFAIDFWTGIADPADNTILPAYRSTDDIHLNAAGHDILAQRVIAKNIFLATLPATFVQYNATNKGNTNIINWTTAQESDLANYEIQRSADGRAFSKIAALSANNNPGTNQYQYTDDLPVKGWNYYKILAVDRDGKKHPSPVVRAYINTGELAIIRSYARSSSQVAVELQNNNTQTVQLQILNNMGTVISSLSRKIDAGSTTLYLNTPLLSNGVYHIKLVTPAASTVASFIKN